MGSRGLRSCTAAAGAAGAPRQRRPSAAEPPASATGLARGACGWACGACAWACGSAGCGAGGVLVAGSWAAPSVASAQCEHMLARGVGGRCAPAGGLLRWKSGACSWTSGARDTENLLARCCCCFRLAVRTLSASCSARARREWHSQLRRRAQSHLEAASKTAQSALQLLCQHRPVRAAVSGELQRSGAVSGTRGCAKRRVAHTLRPAELDGMHCPSCSMPPAISWILALISAVSSTTSCFGSWNSDRVCTSLSSRATRCSALSSVWATRCATCAASLSAGLRRRGGGGSGADTHGSVARSTHAARGTAGGAPGWDRSSSTTVKNSVDRSRMAPPHRQAGLSRTGPELWDGAARVLRFVC